MALGPGADTRESPRTQQARLDTERWATELLSRVFIWLGLPAGLGVLIHGLVRGYASPFLAGHSITVLAVGIAALVLRNRHELLKPIMSAGLTLVGLMALLHFGPNFGAALVFTTAVMMATFLYGPKGAGLVILVALGGLLINAILFVETSWSRPPAIPESAVGWLRLAFTTVVALSGIAYAFHALLIRLYRSVVAEGEAKRDREHALAAYAASQRLEAVGRLAGGVSHDVNNALTIVRSGASALREAELSDAERVEVINDIDAAARAAASTTRQLIAFSRGLPDDGGPADPRQVIEAMRRSLSRLFPENVHVVCKLAPVPRTTMAEGMMTQVLLNLALNARDACDRGGTITLSCEAVDDVVLVRVADDGCGMDAATKTRIFEPFFTSKSRDGSGMGLPMVQAAVTQCGGEIVVHSEFGAGTEVALHLPVASGSVLQEAPPLSTGDGQSGARVLLVEDQPELLRAMSRELRRGGFNVTAASCLRDARAALDAADFDLLCTDGILGDGRAHDVIAALLDKKGGDIPVLVCSGYLPDELELETAVQFLRKPYGPGELVAAAEALLRVSAS